MTQKSTPERIKNIANSHYRTVGVVPTGGGQYEVELFGEDGHTGDTRRNVKSLLVLAGFDVEVKQEDPPVWLVTEGVDR